MDILYVTTSAKGDTNKEAGYLYRVTGLLATGMREANFRPFKEKTTITDRLKL